SLSQGPEQELAAVRGGDGQPPMFRRVYAMQTHARLAAPLLHHVEGEVPGILERTDRVVSREVGHRDSKAAGRIDNGLPDDDRHGEAVQLRRKVAVPCRPICARDSPADDVDSRRQDPAGDRYCRKLSQRHAYRAVAPFETLGEVDGFERESWT